MRVLVLVLLGAVVTPVVADDIDIPERVFDAGKITRGTTLRHDFAVRNPGSTPLSIDAKPG